MILTLSRFAQQPGWTLGALFIGDHFECFTLEDEVRAEKIAGITAIPTGTYKVVLTNSPRFNRVLPLLVDVPNFEGIRIHPGNVAADTDGCILPGVTAAAGRVNESRIAFESLFAKLKAATDEITINILGY